MLKKLESLFIAITFAEEGLHDDSLAFANATVSEIATPQAREIGAC